MHRKLKLRWCQILIMTKLQIKNLTPNEFFGENVVRIFLFSLMIKREVTPMLPLLWYMVLLHFQVSQSSYLILKWTSQELDGPWKTLPSFKRCRPWTGTNKLVDIHCPQGQAPTQVPTWLVENNKFMWIWSIYIVVPHQSCLEQKKIQEKGPHAKDSPQNKHVSRKRKRKIQCVKVGTTNAKDGYGAGNPREVACMVWAWRKYDMSWGAYEHGHGHTCIWHVHMDMGTYSCMRWYVVCGWVDPIYRFISKDATGQDGHRVAMILIHMPAYDKLGQHGSKLVWMHNSTLKLNNVMEHCCSYKTLWT